MRFSIAEIMLVTLAIAVAAAGITRHTEHNVILSMFTALGIGLFAAGPLLLAWRKRSGTLAGRWGAGELAWFWLGLYFFVMLIGNLLAPASRVEENRWLWAACAVSVAAFATITLAGALSWLTLQFDPKHISSRPWFSGRWTNVAGLVLTGVFAAGGLLLVLMSVG